MNRGQILAFVTALVAIGAGAGVAFYSVIAAIAIVAIGVGGPSVATICARIITASVEKEGPR